MSTEALRVERLAGGVVVVSLNLPDQRNAMTETLTAAWEAAIGDLKDDREARVVMVTGEGPAFCAGGDLGWLGVGSGLSVDQLRSRMLRFYRVWLSIRDLEIPAIAAVNGPAVGAGLALALACDLRYAAPEARLSVPFTTLGIHAGMGVSWLLPEVAGLATAREMLLTGRAVSGEEALRLGLVNGLFPADQLRAGCLEVAAGIAGQAPVATRLTTVALRRGHRSLAGALEWEALAQPITMATDDALEGLAAVRERRPPHFTGR